MNSEDYLKERGYDVRLIMNYFPNNPNKLYKMIKEYHPELSDFFYERPKPEEEDEFIEKIYALIIKYEKNKE